MNNNNISFQIGDQFSLPQLSDTLGLDSSIFTIDDIFPGGMGYCLKLKNGDNYYAAKTIYSDSINNKNSYDRFIFEIKTWLTLSAFNGVVETYTTIKINEVPCIISKWMENGNLYNYLNNKDRYLFFNSIIRIVTTLSFIYEKYNIIHRDLKPDNLLFDKKDRIFVSDWGISKIMSNYTNNNSLLEISKKLSAEENGMFMGTLQYASPEQIKSISSIDYRSDIYSLGCIMYEWETGKMPFQGRSIQELITKQLYEKPKEYSSIFKKSNFGIEDIIFKCMEKEPCNRYQSYKELISDINKIAKKYKLDDFDIIKECKNIPIIGNNDIKNILMSHTKGNIGYGIIEEEQINKYFDEALNLSALGEYSKVINILRPFYIKDLFKESSDSYFVQFVCINLSNAVKASGNVEEAIDIIRTIDYASIKPAEYYVNLSQYLIILKMFDLSESFCIEGLKQYPNDQDIIGNLIISLSYQNKFDTALKYAEMKISKNDIHTLSETSILFLNMAENLKNTNFPNALHYYKYAYSLLNKAKLLNPTFFTTRYNLVNVLFKLKRYPESMNEIKEISDINNKSLTPIDVFYTARNYLWVGAFDNGLNFIDKILPKINDSNTIKIEIQRIRAIICLDGLAHSNPQKGIFIEQKSEEFLRGIIKDKDNRTYYDFEYLATILFWCKKYEDAIILLNTGKNIFPEYWRFYTLSSEIYLQNKNIKKSLQEAEKALQLAPWRENIYFIISNIYKYKNNKEISNKYSSLGKEIKEIKKILYETPLNEDHLSLLDKNNTREKIELLINNKETIHIKARENNILEDIDILETYNKLISTKGLTFQNIWESFPNIQCINDFEFNIEMEMEDTSSYTAYIKNIITNDGKEFLSYFSYSHNRIIEYYVFQLTLEYFIGKFYTKRLITNTNEIALYKKKLKELETSEYNGFLNGSYPYNYQKDGISHVQSFLYHTGGSISFDDVEILQGEQNKLYKTVSIEESKTLF
jgi:serine/threonine protein kinase